MPSLFFSFKAANIHDVHTVKTIYRLNRNGNGLNVNIRPMEI